MDRDEAWERFKGRHMGKWSGRSTHVDVRTMAQVRLDEYSWSMSDATFSNRDVRVTGTMSGDGWDWKVAYNIGMPSFYVFEDGSYCAEHEMLEVADIPISRLAVEMCLTISATERLRSFLLYDFESILRRVFLLHEVQDDLWEDRYPTSLLSLVGKWRGETKSARLPSVGAGIISYNSSVSFLWQAADDTVRESFTANKDGKIIDKITSYGLVDDEGDLTAIGWGGPEQRSSFLLNCGSYASAPLSIPPGTPWWCEFSCYINERCRRRIRRLFDKEGNAVSHSIITENRAD